MLLANEPGRFADEGAAFLRRSFEVGDPRSRKYSRAVFDVTRQVGDLVLLCIRIDPPCWAAVLVGGVRPPLRSIGLLC